MNQTLKRFSFDIILSIETFQVYLKIHCPRELFFFKKKSGIRALSRKEYLILQHTVLYVHHLLYYYYMLISQFIHVLNK